MKQAAIAIFVFLGILALWTGCQTRGGEYWADYAAHGRLESWLTSKDVISPEEVPLPEIPPDLDLVQKEWESTEEFEKRVLMYIRTRFCLQPRGVGGY